MARILAAYDTDAVGERVVEYAIDHAGEDDVVHVVHVLDDPEVSVESMRADIELLFADADVDYEVTIATSGEGSDATNVSVTKRLTDTIDEIDPDCVVLGNEEPDTLREVTLGSVSKTIIDRRTVPVILVP